VAIPGKTQPRAVVGNVVVQAIVGVGDNMEHDSRSIEIFRALEDIDLNRFGDYFCWKSGGEGDNGEVLLDELDIYFREYCDGSGK
jgi:hypothetical protein